MVMPVGVAAEGSELQQRERGQVLNFLLFAALRAGWAKRSTFYPSYLYPKFDERGQVPSTLLCKILAVFTSGVCVSRVQWSHLDDARATSLNFLLLVSFSFAIYTKTKTPILTRALWIHRTGEKRSQPKRLSSIKPRSLGIREMNAKRLLCSSNLCVDPGGVKNIILTWLVP